MCEERCQYPGCNATATTDVGHLRSLPRCAKHAKPEVVSPPPLPQFVNAPKPRYYAFFLPNSQTMISMCEEFWYGVMVTDRPITLITQQEVERYSRDKNIVKMVQEGKCELREVLFSSGLTWQIKDVTQPPEKVFALVPPNPANGANRAP